MYKTLVCLNWEFGEKAVNRLSKICEIEQFPKKGIIPTRDYVIQHISDKDILFTVGTEKVDDEVMDKASNLKMISNYSVGYSNIDVEEATKRGIIVTSTVGSANESTADLTWALLMSVARRIVEADKFMREGRFKGMDLALLYGAELNNSTLGIIGFGKIGRAVAKRAKGFNMKVLYYDLVRAPVEVEKELNARYVSMEDLLKMSDFVSIHIHLTKNSYHLIGERELNLMKKTAFLINTSRGAVINEKALVKALREGTIKGAGLDVFEKEPLMTEGLAKLDNVVVTPHIGSSTLYTRSHMAEVAVDNIIDFCNGDIPRNIVNPQVLNTAKNR